MIWIRFKLADCDVLNILSIRTVQYAMTVNAMETTIPELEMPPIVIQLIPLPSDFECCNQTIPQ